MRKKNLIILTNLLILILFISINLYCNPATVKSNDSIQTVKTINAISIKISGKNSRALYPLMIKLELTSDLPKPEKYPIFDNVAFSYFGVVKRDDISLDINKGEYYGILELSDNQYYPLLYTNFANLNIKFGFFYALEPFNKKRITNFTEKECRWEYIEGSFGGQEIICPKLIIDENHKLNIEFDIDDRTKFSSRNTFFIWFSALYVSFSSLTPAGIAVPVILGPIGMERKIHQNLTK